MGQQMFEPEEQEELEGQHRQGWWASISSASEKDRKTREMPRNEHPSTFEEPFAPSTPSASEAYQVQESANATYETGYSGYTPYAQDGNSRVQQSFSLDGDAMEQGYRPYNNYRPSSGSTGTQGTRGPSTQWQVPLWARPQYHPRGSGFRLLMKVLGVLVLIALIIKIIIPLLIAALVVFTVVIVLIGIAALLFFVFALGILRMLGISVRPVHWLRQRRRWRTGRGRRGWYFDV